MEYLLVGVEVRTEGLMVGILTSRLNWLNSGFETPWWQCVTRVGG